MQLVFASNNKNKILEIQSILPDTIEILSLESIGCYEDIPETATTIEGNAILKANYVSQKYGYNCFADDTGLEVEALNGEPGVYSARYAGMGAKAEQHIQKLLNALENIQIKTQLGFQPLRLFASLKYEEGPSVISSEKALNVSFV